jgi:preprotein translocase subunit SecE
MICEQKCLLFFLRWGILFIDTKRAYAKCVFILKIKGAHMKKDVKVKKTNKKKEENNETYLKGVKEELKKVTWPSFKDIVKYTFATVMVILITAGFFSLLNLGLTLIEGVL